MKNSLVCGFLNLKILMAKKAIVLMTALLIIVNLLFDIFQGLLFTESIGGTLFVYIIIFKSSALSLLFGVQMIFLFNYFFKKQKSEGIFDIEIRNGWKPKEQFLMRSLLIGAYILTILLINVFISLITTTIISLSYNVSFHFSSQQIMGSHLFILFFILIFFAITNLVIGLFSETAAIIISTLLAVGFLLTPIVDSTTQNLKMRQTFSQEIDINSKFGKIKNISDSLKKNYQSNDQTKNFIGDFEEFIRISKENSIQGFEYLKLENGTIKDVVELLPKTNSLKIVFEDIEKILMLNESEDIISSLPFILGNDFSNYTNVSSLVQKNVNYVIKQSQNEVTKLYLSPIVEQLNHFEYLTSKKLTFSGTDKQIFTRGTNTFEQNKFRNDVKLMYEDHFQVASVNLVFIEMLTLSINGHNIFTSISEIEDNFIAKSLWDYFYFYNNLMYGANFSYQTLYDSNLFAIQVANSSQFKIKDGKADYLQWYKEQEDYFDKKYKNLEKNKTTFDVIKFEEKNYSYIFWIQSLIILGFTIVINFAAFIIFKKNILI
ncbi:hypothetical protein SSABA_v1c03780 [Spiroplasma sabaudiense Ar-1343]|uniref:Uncharacterized protein n=1 Tax=Spiroplasma sabaudiense Ar-1343 TaxID=1276257 RepID=W6A9T3_9MOLU|nr:hypothetical protein [Spiroplasma sabaudiense]AHI53787.1 hypothetical protein SSABA_v1c03780 [Spiroplasma sabaudiense Ar-1343]